MGDTIAVATHSPRKIALRLLGAFLLFLWMGWFGPVGVGLISGAEAASAAEFDAALNQDDDEDEAVVADDDDDGSGDTPSGSGGSGSGGGEGSGSGDEGSGSGDEESGSGEGAGPGAAPGSVAGAGVQGAGQGSAGAAVLPLQVGAERPRAQVLGAGVAPAAQARAGALAFTGFEVAEALAAAGMFLTLGGVAYGLARRREARANR